MLTTHKSQEAIRQALFGRRYEMNFVVYYARRKGRFLAYVDGDKVFDAKTQIGLLNMMRESTELNTTCPAFTFSMANDKARNQWTETVVDGDTTYCLIPRATIREQ